MPKSTHVLYCLSSPKIISLTPAEAGQITVKQREYNPDTSLPALAARGFYPPISVRRISKNRCRKLRAYDVSALSEARFREKLRTGTMVWRAFDKAVRRKPPVVAADAGPMEIQLREGAVSRCAEAVRQSTTDNSGRWKGEESARLWRRPG